jgi:3-dehydroquinate synthase
MEHVVSFPSGNVTYYQESSIEQLWSAGRDRDIVLLTDSNVSRNFPQLFSDKKHIVVPAGEAAKQLLVVEDIIGRLLALGAHRETLLIGIGGGVITDITGLVAALYMRGIAFGLVPTTLLAMVDAAIGGKNGVNTGLFKNTIGTVRQAEFILFDSAMLTTLPDEEWSNGFAEIIKYACLFDPALFEELELQDLDGYRCNQDRLNKVVNRCVQLKNEIVQEDETEKGRRKLLNFGHTAGHAIENLYGMAHGQAVAVGMVIAAKLSEAREGLPPAITERLIKMLTKYQLPVACQMDIEETMNVLRMDKKRKGNSVDYILLRHLGQPIIYPISFELIETAISDACINFSGRTDGRN